MTLIKTSFGLLFLIALGCNSSKKPTESLTTMDETKKIEIQKEMEANGFSHGVVISSEAEGDCPFTLMLNGKKDVLFDPINLEEQYKSNGSMVWVKYRGLRMQNRCNKASPIEITEIQKRAE